MADARTSILQNVRDQLRMLREEMPKGGLAAWSMQQWWEVFNFLFVIEPQSSNVLAASCSRSHHERDHHDDLLFFVKRQRQKQPRPGSSTSHQAPAPGVRSQQSQEPYFVRRRARQLPPELQLSGADFAAVDWAGTVLLNLVLLQGSYSLTVVACRREALPQVSEGCTWAPGMRVVSKAVYASPTVTVVNLDSSRAKDASPKPCYPDICFAVDNFEDAFDDMVLCDPDQCYCVVLHAVLDMTHDGGHHGSASPLAAPQHTPQPGGGGDVEALSAQLASSSLTSSAAPGNMAGTSTASSELGTTPAPPPQLQQQQQRSGHRQHSGVSTAAASPTRGTSSPSGNDSATASPAWRIATQRRTLFAGFVSHGQIAEFLQSKGGGWGLLDSVLAAGAGSAGPLKDKVVMKGPGGTGVAEVAVTQYDGAAGDAAAAPASSSRLTTSSQPPAGQQQQPLPQRAGGVLERVQQRARQVSSGLQRALAELNRELAAPRAPPAGGAAPCRMQCALMLLKLPVGYLAKELLDAV